MTIVADVLKLAIGALLSIIGRELIDAKRRRSAITKLRDDYKELAGTYVNFRIRDGKEEPTRGTIKLTQQAEGSFEVKGLNADGTVDWRGNLQMSLEWKNTGSGRYEYPDGKSFGVQQFTYIPELHLIHVVGTDTTRGPGVPFVHHWKRIER